MDLSDDGHYWLLFTCKEHSWFYEACDCSQFTWPVQSLDADWPRMTRRKGPSSDSGLTGRTPGVQGLGPGRAKEARREARKRRLWTRSRASQHLNLVNRDHQKRQNLSLSSFEVVVNRLKLNIGYEFIDCVQRSGASWGDHVRGSVSRSHGLGQAGQLHTFTGSWPEKSLWALSPSSSSAGTWDPDWDPGRGFLWHLDRGRGRSPG